MLIVHNEVMAYPDFNREVLVAKSSSLAHVEDISIINLPIIKQRTFFVSDAFYEYEIYRKRKFGTFLRMDGGNTFIDREHPTPLLIRVFESVRQRLSCAKSPMLIQPSSDVISGSAPAVLDRDRDDIGVWFTKFRMNDRNIGT
jgi:hypothetical protein